MKSQKEMVFEAVINIVGDSYNKFINYGNYFKHYKEDKDTLVDIVFKELSESNHEIVKIYPKLRIYVNGLVNNFLRKDIRLNSGDEFQVSELILPLNNINEMKQILKLLKDSGKEFEAITERLDYLYSYDNELA